ncbi:unnamed protein product [Mytilus coruscus]|uniref:Novel STAND NTPase 3 domain-containing protein n=1 Tax=Mytilus coruscus TaxID=42192 RepID=A0A6J8CBH6_MYTCO|nr:unnamed protein product [Mytilus coruscus]
MKWRKRQANFEVTHASTKVLNTVKTHGFVILSGPPGSGKSALAYNTAFMLEKNEEFKILPVSSPDEIRKYLLPETKQVFIIDDPVGKYTVDDISIQRWKNEENFLKKTFISCSNSKLILTCRSYIYKCGFCRKLQVLPIQCDMLSDNLKLSVDERSRIGNRYNIPELNDVTLKMYDFFPLLCANYSEHEDTVMFFVNPYRVLTKEMINIKEKSDIAFLAIALLVVLDNSIERDMLSLENHTIKELLNYLCNECGFKFFPSTTSLLSALSDLIGTYVKEDDNIFSCINDSLFKTLSFIVGNDIIYCILKYGSSKFLANRLQLASIQQEHDESTITVKHEQEELYFKRLLSDIRKGYHSDVLSGIQMKHLRFRTSMIKYIKRLKANDLKRNGDNYTPLHVVSEHGYDDLANELIKLNKEHILYKDKLKRSPLFIACLGGHCKVARTLLVHNKDAIHITNNSDLAPLDAASSNGHYSTVEVLLEYKADVKRKDKKTKKTALYRACENGHYNVVCLLLRHNSDVYNTDTNGLKAVHIACSKGHSKIVDRLLKYKGMINERDAYDRTPLFIACEENHQNIVDTLLQNKANVNQTNKENMTPLHKACENRNEKIVGRLLDKYAKVNVQSVDGLSPLYISCLKGENRIVEILLDKKAEVNIATNQGWTPLLISCSEDHLEICEVLQRSGANINKADKFEFTPLHIACREKHKRIVRFLIECNANVNAVNRQKESPLYISCINESSEIVELLLRKDADVKLCEEKGNSPLHAACLKGNKQIVQLLLDNQADKNKRNNAGKTPFDVVQGIERDKIVEMLNSDIIGGIFNNK